jgi:outer membrane usher protein
VIVIDPQDRVEFGADRLLTLLENVVDPAVLKRLSGTLAEKGALTALEFQLAGISIRYNHEDLALDLDIRSDVRARRTLQLAPLGQERVGTFAEPASVSAYVNVRGNLDYTYGAGRGGLQAPVMFLDGAARIGGIVAESDAIWQPAASGPAYQRLGSRLVYDDQKRLVRASLGDLRTTGRGFQSAPEIAGISLFRSYGILQPQTIIRPTGDRTFRLQRNATVEVEVNGELVRRLQLSPGTYDLRDFPFTQGGNSIRLSILDDAGRSEVLRFDLFLDQSQLAKGLSEFGLYAGVLAPLGRTGPRYTDRPAFSGYYRTGITDALTAGANLQADLKTQMTGVEAVLGTSFGTIGANFSLSRIDGFGMGHASAVTFQRLIQRRGGRADSITASFETRSSNFAVPGVLVPTNPFLWEAGAAYSRAFSDRLFGSIDGRYSKARGEQADVANYRGIVGWRLTERLTMDLSGRYERDETGSRLSGLFSITVRMGQNSFVRGDFDTRFDRARLSYNRFSGQGVGAYQFAADAERTRFGSGVNAVGTFYANRAELGLSHFGTFTRDFGASAAQRSSLRFASSLAFADGGFSVGRPIFDSFAIVRSHRSLKNSEVLVDPGAAGTTAYTGVLGAATHPNLGSYSERTLTVDAPSAPAGADLGQGTFRLLPPYRSGYLLTVGSDYNVTALGRLLNADGEPLALVSGQAIEISKPGREPVTFFTNRDGRFGIAGLAPGQWRLEIGGEAAMLVNIQENGEGIVRLGELKTAGPK